MAIQIQGNGGVVAEVESATRASRVTTRPLDTVANGGSFSLSAITGIMAAGIASASEVVQFRWVSTTHLALIKRVRITSGVLGTAFTAGTVLFDMTVARAWTAAGTGGGTATLTTNQGKRRTSMQTSQFGTTGEVRIATTAALGAGTKTLDTMPIRSVITGVPNTAFIPMLSGDDGLLFQCGPSEYPLVLAASEGFVIRTTVPATGTWTAHVAIDWEEVTTSAY
jgi:hypothetical protein